MKKKLSICQRIIILSILIIPIIAFAASTDTTCPVTGGSHDAYCAGQKITLLGYNSTYHYYDHEITSKCTHRYRNGKQCPYEDTSTFRNISEAHTKGSYIASYGQVIAGSGNALQHRLMCYSQYHCGYSSKGCGGYYYEDLPDRYENHSCIDHVSMGNNLFKHICQCGASKIAPYSCHYN